VYLVRMDQMINDNAWSLFDVFDSHSGDLSRLYIELFDDEDLNPAVADELMDCGNVVLIRSILLLPEYRGLGLAGLLALAIAERFNDRDIVALKPWPMTVDDPRERGRSMGAATAVTNGAENHCRKTPHKLPENRFQAALRGERTPVSHPSPPSVGIATD
jgi:hypothetical protein